jgi:hypothetical protein
MATGFRYNSTVEAKCSECGYVGSPWKLELHSCDIQQSGGRCIDYPCCGHVDGDGCQTLPQHTGEYWSQVLAGPDRYMAFEPGSPEWYDALEEREDYDEDDEDWED